MIVADSTPSAVFLVRTLTLVPFGHTTVVLPESSRATRLSCSVRGGVTELTPSIELYSVTACYGIFRLVKELRQGRSTYLSAFYQPFVKIRITQCKIFGKRSTYSFEVHFKFDRLHFHIVLFMKRGGTSGQRVQKP